MVEYVILLHGLVDGSPSAYDETYLTRFDFLTTAADEAILESTPDISKARRFPDMLTAMQAWRVVDPRAPLRADGKPNRPLTAFSVTIQPV